jgi:hypothetical protein
MFIGQLVYMLDPQKRFETLFGNARINIMSLFSCLHEICNEITYVKERNDQEIKTAILS